jgi:hypothetical protein
MVESNFFQPISIQTTQNDFGSLTHNIVREITQGVINGMSQDRSLGRHRMMGPFISDWWSASQVLLFVCL